MMKTNKISILLISLIVTVTSQLADNQVETKSKQSQSLSDWIFNINFPIFNILKPNPLTRVRRQSSDIPEALVECIYGEDKKNPITKYMSSTNGKSCRNGEIMIKGDSSDVACCRYTGGANTVPQVYASRCVFENGQPIMNLMHFPASDLVCKEPNLYEVASFKVPHIITGKMVSKACCKKIETTTTIITTTTPSQTTMYIPPYPTNLEPGEVCAKAGPDCIYDDEGQPRLSFMDFESLGAFCRPNQITRMIKDSKYRRKICCDYEAGAKTVQLPPLCAPKCTFDDDGVTPLKWSLLYHTPDLICKEGYEILVVDTSAGQKSCCKPVITTTTSTTSTSTTTTSSVTSTTSTTLYTSTSTAPTTTSFVSTSSSASSTTISTSTTSSTTISPSTTSSSTLSPSTTSSTSLSQSTTSSLSSISSTTSLLPPSSTSSALQTTLKSDNGSTTITPPSFPSSTISPNTTKPAEISTTPIADHPSALQTCYYKADRKVKTDLMELCRPNKKCRTNEVLVNETIGGQNFCCCDLRKDLPPPSEEDPKLEAPKCYYNADGNVIPFSTLTAGLDLICPESSKMVNYTDEKTPQSCCILKDQTTIEPMTVPPGEELSTSTLTATSTAIGTSTTTAFVGKRTAAPKKMPDRVVKPGECPSCIMPESAQKADINWVIAHLEKPGPPVGKCPFGWTMRRIYPVVERRDLTATKCCCECDAFPLPVKLSG